MKKLTLLLVCVLIYTVSPGSSHAAIKKTAQTGLQFLKVDVGARAAAMGGAYMMVGDDANAMFYNPGGIAFVQKDFDFFAARTEWIADIAYTADMCLNIWAIIFWRMVKRLRTRLPAWLMILGPYSILDLRV
ncbi:MAG: hypothetical protein P8Y60_19170 [Calditrichota bacterium]